MRTHTTIKPTAAIAVTAEHLHVTSREFVADEPKVNCSRAMGQFTPMFTSIVLNVIKGQKQFFGLTTTCAKGKPRWENQTDSGQNKLAPSPTRGDERARTYQGIADAMAEQWGIL